MRLPASLVRAAPFAALFIWTCAPQKRIGPSPRATAESFRDRLQDAGEWARRGCYNCLREALSTYEALLDSPVGAEASERAFYTYLLLSLREKELGIPGDRYLEKAFKLAEARVLAPRETYWTIAESIRSGGRSFAELSDEGERESSSERLSRLKSWDAMLEQPATSEPVLAYLRLSLRCDGLPHGRGGPIPNYAEIFPDYPALHYKEATCPQVSESSLVELLQIEPLFDEASFFLGRRALARKNLFEAEKHLLRAQKVFPDSAPAALGLADAYFRLGELGESLAYYDKVLSLLPQHRDALVGRTQCLSFLEKHEDAIRSAESLLEHGTYYLGDAYYWMGWNQNQLRELEPALKNVEKAKNYLPMDGKTFTLAGIIAYQRNELDLAESNLAQAVDFDRTNCEASLYLGQVYGALRFWERSGPALASAASCYANRAEMLQGEIAALERESLSEERRRRLIGARQKQLDQTQRLEATASYNAAVGYLNSGRKEDSRFHAQKAATHPDFKERAEALLAQIGGGS